MRCRHLDDGHVGEPGHEGRCEDPHPLLDADLGLDATGDARHQVGACAGGALAQDELGALPGLDGVLGVHADLVEVGLTRGAVQAGEKCLCALATVDGDAEDGGVRDDVVGIDPSPLAGCEHRDVTGEGLGDGELAEARRHITLLGELLGVLGSAPAARTAEERRPPCGGHCGDGLRGDRVDVVVGGRRDEPLGDLAEPVAGGTPDVAVRLLHPDPPGRQEDAERQDDERDGDGDQLVDQ